MKAYILHLLRQKQQKFTMILLQISNEAILGSSFLIAVIVTVVISSIIYLVMRRTLNGIKSQFNSMPTQFQQINTDLNSLKIALPRYDEVSDLKKTVGAMDEQQKTFITSVTSALDGFKRASAEEMNNVRTDIIKVAQAKSIEAAKTHLESQSVSRDEFNGLKEKIETVLASEEIAERIELLSSLFDSDNIRTLIWQCKLIRLTQNGLAPDAEEDVLLQEGIPLGTGKAFLKRLVDKGIVNSKKVESYYLIPEFTWLSTFAEDPDTLQHSLQNHVKKEQEYQKHVRENVTTIEDGLVVIAEQYEVDSGRIDILCRDRTGLDVALELKYPAANNEVIGQILRYKEDQKRKTGNGHMRFVVVAPKITAKLKDLLVNNTIECREIPF